MKKAIINSLAFYDIFDYPLTLIEVFRYLQTYDDTSVSSPLYEIQNILESSEKVSQKNGMYFLEGREDIVDKRLGNAKRAIARFKKASKLFVLMRHIPFVRLSALCNVDPLGMFREGSDIDSFVVVRNGRIWMSRALTTTLFFFLGEWRRFVKSNKLCFSFFVTDTSLNLEKISKKPLDPYLYNWIALVMPIYDNSNAMQDFANANSWVRKYLPNYQPWQTSWKLRCNKKDSWIKKSLEWVLSGRVGDLLEGLARSMQLFYMKKIGGAVIDSARDKNTTDVIVNDKMLKFHENDRRVEFREKLFKKLESI